MKKNKVIVTLLVIIIVLLIGIIGFGGYKYMELQKNNDKLTSENKNITEELNKQKTETEEAKNEQEKASSTNDYSLFVKKMKEEREKLDGVDNGRKYITRFIDYMEKAHYVEYEVKLSAKGVLTVNNKTLANNVLFYRLCYFGNGGFQGMYYVNEEGKAFFADVEYALYQKRKIEIKEVKNASNIVNILPAYTDEYVGNDQLPGGNTVFFVDINGNIISE